MADTKDTTHIVPYDGDRFGRGRDRQAYALCGRKVSLLQDCASGDPTCDECRAKEAQNIRSLQALGVEFLESEANASR